MFMLGNRQNYNLFDVKTTAHTSSLTEWSVVLLMDCLIAIRLLLI